MPNNVKTSFLKKLNERYGPVQKLPGSQSLYDIAAGAARVYVRYSRVHGESRTFYGLREEDLRQLEAHPSVLCFLWDGQTDPLLVPFPEYEDVFQSTSPAKDGQYKAQVILNSDGIELYIAQAGRFNVEGFMGWDRLEALVGSARLTHVPEFSHSQVQTLLGAIGAAKNMDVWVPANDRGRLDWSLTPLFRCSDTLPQAFRSIQHIVEEVDVIWTEKGSSEPTALFEVEHSTPIYSGLLRFNDIHLTVPAARLHFSVVANDVRRGLFVRQLRRPTFEVSGLSDLCTFLEYKDVYHWHSRLRSG